MKIETKVSHTPGPWHIEPWSYGGKRIVVTIQTQEHAIAQIVESYRPDDPNSEVEKANARLIAASPDLLAAAKEAHAELIEGYTEMMSLEHAVQCPIVAQLQAAIDKAERA